MLDTHEGRCPSYGGLILDPRCPNCARFWKQPEGIQVRRTSDGWNEMIVRLDGIECSRCGPIQPEIVENNTE